MIFALGFLFAGLLSLLLLPAFWRRAMTLSKRQLEMQMPLSMAEIVAERDQLRAEFAAEQRRLEQRLDLANDRRAQDKVELGERMIAATRLEQDLATLRAEAEKTEKALFAANNDITEASAQLFATTKQLYDVESALDQRKIVLEALTTRHEALNIQSDEQRTTIAGLETRLSGRDADIEALERDLETVRIELADARAELEALAHERDQFRADAHNAQGRRQALQLEFEAQARRMEDLRNEMRGLEREKSRAAADNSETVRLLEDERRRVRELSGRIAEHNEALKALEKKAAQDAELARGSKAVVEGALAAQRRENELSRAELAGLREELRQTLSEAAKRAGAEAATAKAVSAVAGPAAKGEFPALRKAISDIGFEIARVATELRDAKNADVADRNSTPQPAHTNAAE